VFRVLCPKKKEDSCGNLPATDSKWDNDDEDIFFLMVIFETVLLDWHV
jgi:hypothetical protein